MLHGLLMVVLFFTRGGIFWWLPLFWVSQLGWYAGAAIFFQSAVQLMSYGASISTRENSSTTMVSSSVKAPWHYAAKYLYFTWRIVAPLNIVLATTLSPNFRARETALLSFLCMVVVCKELAKRFSVGDLALY